MKLKGINPIEQHVEKLVLGVVALVLLAVLVIQFALPPQGVSVGSASDIPPEDALDPVADEAREAMRKPTNSPPERLPKRTRRSRGTRVTLSRQRESGRLLCHTKATGFETHEGPFGEKSGKSWV